MDGNAKSQRQPILDVNTIARNAKKRISSGTGNRTLGSAVLISQVMRARNVSHYTIPDVVVESPNETWDQELGNPGATPGKELPRGLEASVLGLRADAFRRSGLRWYLLSPISTASLAQKEPDG